MQPNDLLEELKSVKSVIEDRLYQNLIEFVSLQHSPEFDKLNTEGLSEQEEEELSSKLFSEDLILLAGILSVDEALNSLFAGVEAEGDEKPEDIDEAKRVLKKASVYAKQLAKRIPVLADAKKNVESAISHQANKLKFMDEDYNSPGSFNWHSSWRFDHSDDSVSPYIRFSIRSKFDKTVLNATWDWTNCIISAFNFINAVDKDLTAYSKKFPNEVTGLIDSTQEELLETIEDIIVLATELKNRLEEIVTDDKELDTETLEGIDSVVDEEEEISK